LDVFMAEVSGGQLNQRQTKFDPVKDKRAALHQLVGQGKYSAEEKLFIGSIKAKAKAFIPDSRKMVGHECDIRA
jgi:hypothetical protein